MVAGAQWAWISRTLLLLLSDSTRTTVGDDWLTSFFLTGDRTFPWRYFPQTSMREARVYENFGIPLFDPLGSVAFGDPYSSAYGDPEVMSRAVNSLVTKPEPTAATTPAAAAGDPAPDEAEGVEAEAANSTSTLPETASVGNSSSTSELVAAAKAGKVSIEPNVLDAVAAAVALQPNGTAIPSGGRREAKSDSSMSDAIRTILLALKDISAT